VGHLSNKNASPKPTPTPTTPPTSETLTPAQQENMLRYGNKNGPAKVVTKALSPTPQTITSAQEQENMLRYGTKTGPTKIIKPVVDGTDVIGNIGKNVSNIWGNTLSLGQSVLDTFMTPSYAVAGGAYDTTAQVNAQKAMEKKVMDDLKAKGLYDKTEPIIKNGKIVGIRSYRTEALNKLYATEAYKNPTTTKEYKQANPGNVNSFTNAVAWINGERPKTGHDVILQSKGHGDWEKMNVNVPVVNWNINLPSLAFDVATDPTTIVGGKLVTIPAKFAVDAAKGSLKGAAKAILHGDVTANTLNWGIKDAAERLKNIKENPAVTPLKANSSVLNQYTSRPIIKENLKRVTGPAAEILSKLDTTISDKLVYNTVKASPTVSNVLASALELGYKSAASRVIQDIAKEDLKKIFKAETNAAKTNSKLNKTVQTVDVAAHAVMDGGKVQELQQLVPHISGDGIHVLDGDKLRPFKTEADAQAWINQKKGVPAETPVKLTRGLPPVVDSAPDIASATNLVLHAPVSSSIGKDAKKFLTNIEKLAKGVKGVSKVENVFTKIGKIVNRADGNIAVSDFAKATLKQVVKNGADGFAAIKNLMGKKGDPNIARLLLGRELLAANGKRYTIEQLISQGITWEKLGKDGQAQVILNMEKLLTPAKNAAKTKLESLIEVVGPDLANKIAVTGILEGKAVTQAQIKEILKDIPELQTRTYGSFAELVSGLRKGDQVDIKALQKIVQAIDPENSVLKQGIKTLSADNAHAQLSEILMGKGVKTVADAQRSLDLINATNLMKAQGVSLADALAMYAEQRITGKALPESAAVDEARAAASTRLAKEKERGQTSVIDRTLESINAGFNGTFDYMNSIQNAPNVIENVSSFGDLATRTTTKAFQAETRAMLLRQMTASFEARMLGNMFGLIRRDLSYVKTKIGKKTISVAVEPKPIDLLNEFLLRGEYADDSILSILGTRITWRKEVKGSSGEAHYMYASIAKFAKIVNETGGTDVLLRALFPDVSKKLLKTDALSTIAISKAVRHIIETEERNLPHSINEIRDILKTRGEKQGVAWSDTYKTQVDEITTQLAEHLVRPDVIERFQMLHRNRAIAAIEEAIPESNALSEDLWGSLFEAIKANRLRGLESTADNAKEIREWFNKFVWSSGIFHHQDSEIARSVFQSSVMLFMRNGRLEKLASDAEASMALIGGPKAKLESDRTLYQEVMDELNHFFEKQNNDNVANISANVKPFPSKIEIATATDKLTEAKQAYENHIKLRDNVTTKAQITAWEKRFTEVQNLLNDARKNAQQLGIQTHHWLGGDWVPAEQYDYAAAKLAAEKAADGMMALPEGSVKATVIDTPSTIPTPRALTKEKAATLLEKWKDEVSVRNQGLMAGKHEQIATDILANEDKFAQLGLDEAGTAARMYQETIARVYSESRIEVTLTGSVERGKWEGLSSIDNAVVQTGQQRFAENWSATGGKWNLRPTLSAAESRIHTRIHGLADAAHSIQRKYSKGANRLNYDQIIEGTRLAISQITPGPEIDKVVAAYANDVRRLLDPIFGDKNVSEITSAGVTSEALMHAFKRFGLTEELGFKFPGNEMNPGELHRFPNWIPFSKAPEGVKPGSEAYAQWERELEKFKQTATNPLTAVTRLAQAVEFAKTEHTIVNDFVSRFGHKAQGLSREQAIQQGWVSIKGIASSGTNLTEYIRNGELFYPDIAREFLSINREWNKLFMGNKMNGIVYAMMELTGFMKASQTVLRLGHHAANIFGDLSTAIIVGLRNPLHMWQGIKLASSYASQDVLSIFGKAENKLERRLIRSMERIDGHTLPVEVLNNQTPAATITIIRNGKPTQMRLDFKALKHMLEENNVLIGNIQATDIQGLNDVLSHETGFGTMGAQRKLGETILTGVRKGMQGITTIPGEATSYYSNIIRAAHAMSILQSRSWKSVNEAMNAVNETMNRYHPTIQSLAGAERTGPRLAITYYTWLRVAHNAFIDMAMNHTAAMMVPSKLQYNAATTAGLTPTSVGKPWSPDITAPNYLTYSVYGPTTTGQNGPTMIRPGFLALDVLDTWNFTYDPAYSVSQNIEKNKMLLAKTLVSSGNQVALSLAEGMLPISLRTFAPKTNDTVEGEVGSFLDQFGWTKLAEGLNLYTPTNKQEGNTKYPLTPEERAVLLNNWLTGQRKTPVITKKDAQNFKQEVRDRIINKIKNGNQ
jgi:hypothetical protein